MRKKVYIAAKFEDYHRVRQLRDILRERGHHVTYDWTVHVTQGEHPQDYRHNALMDLRGVATCDVLIIYPHEQGKGEYVEMGGALILGKPVVALPYDRTKIRNVFQHHPLVFDVADETEAIEFVENYPV